MGAESSINNNSYKLNVNDEFIISLIDKIANEYTNNRLQMHNTYNHCSDCTTKIDSISDLYNILAQIGRGVSGRVFLAQSKQTYKQYAVKQMPKYDAQNHGSFVREMQALKRLNHPNVIKLNDVYTSRNAYYIATEHCSGGTLSQRIKMKGRCTERQAAQYIQQILTAIDHIHSNNIVHRDIKPSNIVFANDDIRNPILKLIDFGESEIIVDRYKTDRTLVGSLHFYAPEAIIPRLKRDLFAGDMWSVGVIAYILIHGFYPFHAKDLRSMIRCIMKTDLKLNANLSDSGKDFIQSLLCINFKKRLNAKQALQHEWITNQLEQDIVDKEEDKICTNPNIVHTRMFSDDDLNELDISGMLAEIDEELNNNSKSPQIMSQKAELMLTSQLYRF